MDYQPMRHGLANAFEIAKILLACSIIEESDLLLVTEQLMDGNFKPRKENEIKESKKAS